MEEKSFMGFFDKITEPIFVKEDSEAEKQLAALREIQSRLSGEGTEALEQEILSFYSSARKP